MTPSTRKALAAAVLVLGTLVVAAPAPAASTYRISGTVTDGSGQGWPLYARITVDNHPNLVAWSNPFSGEYRLQLPDGRSTLHFDPVYPGYEHKTVRVVVAGADVARDVTAEIDKAACAAPGYTASPTGYLEEFTRWTGTTPSDGWTNQRLGGEAEWTFDNASGMTPPPRSDGDFAKVDLAELENGPDANVDTALSSGRLDLTGIARTRLMFDTAYQGTTGQAANAQLSLDGGLSWFNVWHADTESVTGRIVVPIPDAVHQADVRVRFRFTSAGGTFWAIDNVFVGRWNCVPMGGGLVAGTVRDAESGMPINGAVVSRRDFPGEHGVSVATPDDPRLSDGFYWFWTIHPGRNNLVAIADGYAEKARGVTVVPGAVTTKFWALDRDA